MNKQAVINIAKKLFLASILTVTFLAVQNKALAKENAFNGDPTVKVNGSENVSVKYIGSNSEGSFFNVKYANENGQNFKVVIKDENDETLYEGLFNEKSFDKRFLLPQDNVASLITIAIKSEKDNFIQSYSISVKSNTITDVVVSKN